MPNGAVPANKDAHATAVQFARIDGDFRAVNARIDTVESTVAEGFKAAAERDRSQDSKLDTLIRRSETASATRGKLSMTQMGAIGISVVTIGGVVWAGLIGPLHARIDAERAARVSTERLINDRLAHEREILRTIKPDAPEYRDVPGLE